MLILQRIEIENFVCFDNIVVEPSSDPERPLTVIRAENGSGKTTFLRALRWGMYGDPSLPGKAASFPVHPAGWRTDTGIETGAAGIETRVAIEFTADGSSRHYADSGNSAMLYRLERTVTTKAVQASTEDDPDFRRIGERATLMFRALDGTWSHHEHGADAVIGELLPWDLRDFFVMDADEAADFVGGGSENKTISRHEVQQKTTFAISSLLGIDVFKSGHKRVESIARDFSRNATKAIGDKTLTSLDEELQETRTQRQELEAKIAQERTRQTELADRLEEVEEQLEASLRESGAHDDLQKRLSSNRVQSEDALKRHKDCAARLGGALQASELWASLAASAVNQTYAHLKPLYDQGQIPASHLPFVKGLMESGECVCGQTLLDDNEYGIKVKEQISNATDEAARAGYLAELHDAARSLRQESRDSTWNERRETDEAEFSELELKLSDLRTEKKDISIKLDAINDSNIHSIRDEQAALKQQYESCLSALGRHEDRLPDLKQQEDSLSKAITQRQRNELAAADHRACERLSRFVVEILDRAYATIEQQQVRELTERMNRLFHQMAANVSDDDFEDFLPNKATLRMISQVGVRQIEGSADKFEIFALNSRGRYMPPVQINGASRRVLALSFVLALCIESQTRAPLIADSLLNFMSGSVRRNTLRATSEHATQPILLLTGADLESPTEVETVAERAGATYTLTGQWDAIEAGSGGDVVNWTQQGQVSLLCGCGPRQYCRVCERTGQADAPGWTENPN
ncbi:MAG: AAA family ATPase [Acidimicrobiaceae bacterium]|nr:AAA family ATPase [Acidimicrobiaceae bacterium]